MSPLFLLAASLSLSESITAAEPAGLPADRGRFVLDHWYERGIEHGNPKTTGRLRVNAPNVARHPVHGKRPETRDNGLMLIPIDHWPVETAGATLCLEVWGGHPHTAHPRVGVNGRSTYPLSDPGVAAGNCAYYYPRIALELTDLVNGYNAFQFNCDQGESFWGHFIVDNACLRLELRPGDPLLEASGGADFAPTVQAAAAPDAEAFDLELLLPEGDQGGRRIAGVDFFGWYEGYDENGDGLTRDWHGMTKARQAYGHMGTAALPPYRLRWDVSMLPEQRDMAVRAVVRFVEPENLRYQTASTHGLATPRRTDEQVRILHPDELPRPYWSRANRRVTTIFNVDIDPATITQCQLHIAIWDGGRGDTVDPFTLNGQPIKVAGDGLHDLLYRVVEIDPRALRQGDNELSLVCDTEHHGIEVPLPGPALVIRYRK